MRGNVTTVDISKYLKLYFIMGSANCRDVPETVLEQALEAGITMFQFREKGPGSLTGVDRKKLAIKLQYLCHGYGIPFIINDDLDLALELDADGVHIGQGDGDMKEIRRLIDNKILGVSAHDVKEAQLAIESGADYLGVGPMYRTSTKKDIRSVKGPSVITEMRSNGLQVPIVGIGGIGLDGIKPVISAGADGVAVISAISDTTDVRKRVSEMKGEVMNE